MNPRTSVTEAAGAVPEITSLVHDLRNPLSAIRASAELLIRSELSRAQIQRIALSLHGASTRMKDLLDELLSRHRGATGGRKAADLRELVNSAVDKIVVAAEGQSVRIVRNVPENLVITLDRQRIERVLVNLLVNSLEVMPGGGSIHITAIPERGAVVIQVRDTGPGIAPEMRDRLFRAFATSGKAGGLGLGLALSRQAVLDHGGEMWVESSTEGACFRFSLPGGGGLAQSSIPAPAGLGFRLFSEDAPDRRRCEQ